MNSDNDAARSGLEEVSGHIQVLNARLAQLRKTGAVSSDAESPLEDLQDYYERAVQLRTMRITTLEEEKTGLTAEAERSRAAKRRLEILVLLSSVGLVMFAVENASPGTTTALAFEYWSHAAIALVVGFFVRRNA
tara:strand:- start:43 stop:447 length:405 start_codon:yes stop_codon:yes gene_type:complete